MTKETGAPPFGRLRFLYVGSSDVERDILYYRDILGGEMVWNVKSEGTQVAAFRMGGEALTLLADHMPAPSCEPVYEVDDIRSSARTLKSKGWKPDASFEIPNGPCHIFKDPSGNRLVIFQDIRPDVMRYIAGH